jgi:hypothetical protein
MSFFKKSQRPLQMPKQAEEEVGPVQETLNELNAIRREVHRRLRAGERRSSLTMVILDDKRTTLIRRLIHDMGVTPVLDDCYKRVGRLSGALVVPLVL